MHDLEKHLANLKSRLFGNQGKIVFCPHLVHTFESGRYNERNEVAPLASYSREVSCQGCKYYLQ